MISTDEAKHLLKAGIVIGPDGGAALFLMGCAAVLAGIGKARRGELETTETRPELPVDVVIRAAA